MDVKDFLKQREFRHSESEFLSFFLQEKINGTALQSFYTPDLVQKINCNLRQKLDELNIKTRNKGKLVQMFFPNCTISLSLEIGRSFILVHGKQIPLVKLELQELVDLFLHINQQFPVWKTEFLQILQEQSGKFYNYLINRWYKNIEQNILKAYIEHALELYTLFDDYQGTFTDLIKGLKQNGFNPIQDFKNVYRVKMNSISLNITRSSVQLKLNDSDNEAYFLKNILIENVLQIDNQMTVWKQEAENFYLQCKKKEKLETLSIEALEILVHLYSNKKCENNG